MATFHVRCVHKVSGAEYMAPMKADSIELAKERAVDEGHIVAADQSPRSIATMRSSVRDGVFDVIKILALIILCIWLFWWSGLMYRIADMLYR